MTHETEPNSFFSVTEPNSFWHEKHAGWRTSVAGPPKINWHALARSTVNKELTQVYAMLPAKGGRRLYRLLLLAHTSLAKAIPPVCFNLVVSCAAPLTSTVNWRRSVPGLPTEQHYSQPFITAGNTRRSRVKRTPASRRRDRTEHRAAEPSGGT